MLYDTAKRVDSWHLHSFRYLFLVNKLLCLPPSVSQRVEQQLISVKFISFLQQNFWLLLFGLSSRLFIIILFQFHVVYVGRWYVASLLCAAVCGSTRRIENVLAERWWTTVPGKKKKARQRQKTPNETLIKREKFPYYGNNFSSTRLPSQRRVCVYGVVHILNNIFILI